MRDFVKPNATVMNRVIHYSILQRDIKVALLELRKTKLIIRGLGLLTPNFNDLNEIEMQLIRRSEEIQNACKILLLPLFDGIDFGHKYLNHWALSMPDIRKGFTELEEIIQYKDDKPIIFGRRYIILLYDYTDPTLGIFYSGELIGLEKAIHFVDNIPEQKDKVKGMYDAVLDSIHIASRYRNLLMH